MYLFLFIPAWVCLALSIYFGDRVQRGAITVKMVNKNLVADIHQQINGDFDRQLRFLTWAGAILVIWLFAYLVWWVFYRKAQEETGN